VLPPSFLQPLAFIELVNHKIDAKTQGENGTEGEAWFESSFVPVVVASTDNN